MASDTTAVVELARKIRVDVLRMTHKAGASHAGTSLSIADVLAVLYGSVLRIQATEPEWPDRDRLVVSKGHSAAAVYAVLAQSGFYPRTWLDTFCQDGSRLAGHVTRGVPGVEASTGSLGHGLAIGCGMAIGAKRSRRRYRVFVLMSDGECDEGSTWEAALFAPHHKLDNLVAIVDYNKIQSLGSVKEVLDLEPLAEKWRAFGWSVQEVDGHDHEQLLEALGRAPLAKGRPSCIIAHTVKGKGVSFMEHQLAWHYKSPDAEQLRKALQELEVPR